MRSSLRGCAGVSPKIRQGQRVQSAVLAPAFSTASAERLRTAAFTPFSRIIFPSSSHRFLLFVKALMVSMVTVAKRCRPLFFAANDSGRVTEVMEAG